MNISYNRNHRDSYMVIEEAEIEDTYEQQMLRQNQIKTLLEFYTMEINGRVQFWYNITGKESLKDYLERDGLSLEVLEKILVYMKLAYEEISQYLIAQEHIALAPETIFLDKRSRNFGLSLCYLPVKNDPAPVQFRTVLEFLLVVVNHEDRDFARLCYELYEMSLREECSFEELIERAAESQPQENIIYIEERIAVEEEETADKNADKRLGEKKKRHDEIEKRPGEKKKNHDEIEKWLDEEVTNEEEEKKTVFEVIRDFFKRLRRNKEEVPRKIEFEDFVIEPDMDFSEPTVLLSADNIKCAGKLIYDGRDGGEDSYMIDKETFRIGSNPKKNDAVLHSKAVSNVHAKITRKDMTYYLTDLNSTNGTYCNGIAIGYHQQVELKPMDQIFFADVAYVFM